MTQSIMEIYNFPPWELIYIPTLTLPFPTMGITNLYALTVLYIFTV